MRLLALASILAALAFTASNVQLAEAHPLPKGTSVKVGLHRICTAAGICRDRAPQPKTNCWWGIRDKTEEIYDPKLDAIVKWRCTCPWGEYGACFWTRVSFRPAPPAILIPPQKHHVWDWMRRCASLVCLKFRVDHFYPSLAYYPNRL